MCCLTKGFEAFEPGQLGGFFVEALSCLRAFEIEPSDEVGVC
jgi:hypothetical protein